MLVGAFRTVCACARPGPALGELRSDVSCISRTERARVAAHASKRLYIVDLMYRQLGRTGIPPPWTFRPRQQHSRATHTHKTTAIRHMVIHCKCALCGTIQQTCVCSTIGASSVCVAGLLACVAACERRHKSHWLFCRARLAPARRAAAEHVYLGRTSTPELACDAGTPGTLSAGDLGRYGELAHLLSS